MSDIYERIAGLKKERNAVILAHFYQPAEIYKIADFVGDSLDLSKKAKASDADVIVFCGVYFMAESAKILSPEKKVFIPNKLAGCPMADMIHPYDVKKLRAAHPNAVVVTYVNSSAEVKAESDICCTSSNAVRLVKGLKEKEIIFIPDKNLGGYVASQVSEKTFYFFDGYCPTHNRITIENINRAKHAYPEAELLVHPETPIEVAAAADFVGSTSEIIAYVTNSEKNEFIIGTEEGILTKLKSDNPHKIFHMAAGNFICPNMKKITLADVLYTLETMDDEVILSEKIIEKAANSLERMIKA